METVLSPAAGQENTFSFAELKETPTTIYLIVPPHYLNVHQRFIRLFINLVISQMSIGGKSKVPVLMLIDEFLALGYMEQVAKAFSLMAGYNLLLWPFVQAIAPLKNLYGDVADAFIQNSRAVQVFAVSDEATTKFVSEKLGEHRTGNAAQRPPLRTPTEISREVSAESDCQYVIRAGAAPLFLKKVRYYESDELFKPGASIPEWIAQRWYPFAGRYDPDPDHSPQK